MAAIIPQDAWMCCQCNGANVIKLEDYCPDCGHYRCDACLGPGQSYGDTPAMGFSTDSLPLAGGAFASSSSGSSFGRLPASSLHEHHINGFNNATIITNTVEDVWTCCQCSAENLTANSPERCPICAHYKDDSCT